MLRACTGSLAVHCRLYFMPLLVHHIVVVGAGFNNNSVQKLSRMSQSDVWSAGNTNKALVPVNHVMWEAASC